MANGPSFRVGTRSALIQGVSGIILLLVFGVGGFFINHHHGLMDGLVFTVAGILAFLVLKRCGNFYFSEKEASHENYFGTSSVLWNEVHKVSVGGRGSIFLHGNDGKGLWIMSPASWSGPQRREAYALFRRKLRWLETSGIRFERGIFMSESVAAEKACDGCQKYSGNILNQSR